MSFKIHCYLRNCVTMCKLMIVISSLLRMCGWYVKFAAMYYRVTVLKPTRILFQALVYRDGNLVSGSLEALVQHMVPTEEYYPDRAYLFAFLLSARLFIKPHELLGEVCALCEHQQNLNGEGGKVSISILSIRETIRSPFLISSTKAVYYCFVTKS